MLFRSATDDEIKVLRDYACTVNNDWEQNMVDNMLNDVVRYPILKVRCYAIIVDSQWLTDHDVSLLAFLQADAL